MSKQKRLLWISDLMLLAVAMVWGTSYGVAKSALALRSLRRAKASELIGTLGTGALLLSILLAETFGISLTRASNAAFLISLCVVLTPLVEWALLHRKPSHVERIAVVVSLAGATVVRGGV